jgi:acetoin utilization deacetylase AcuC-like enzyme
MENLVLFYPEGHQAHMEPGHAERPERIEVVRQSLERAGWWTPFQKLTPSDLPFEFLATVHDRGYLEYLQTACQRADYLDEDTYTTPASYRLALNALGGAAAVAEAVWRAGAGPQPAEKLRGFVLGRPPGHHAERRRGMGFCLVNNIAIAAEYLLSFPMPGVANARRLAIVDLDLHHGNGTQDIFWRRDDVLFISTHQSPLYPGSGFMDETGAGPGAGYTVNLPFPPATGDRGYRAAMDEIILPLIDRFEPETLLVSLGFDPHWRDPLGHLLLSAGGIGDLVKSLAAWADGHCRSRIVVVMEGGYDLPAVSACALATAAALLGEDFDDPLGLSPRPEGKSWQMVVRHARQTWRLSD